MPMKACSHGMCRWSDASFWCWKRRMSGWLSEEWLGAFGGWGGVCVCVCVPFLLWSFVGFKNTHPGSTWLKKLFMFMKGPILSLANSTVYPIYGHSHFCEKKNKAANFWSWKICSPQTLEEVDFHRILFGFCNLEPTPAGCGSSRNELTSLVGDLPKAQAWRVSSLQLLLSGWWEDLGCRPLGLKHLKTFETYVPSVGSSCVAGMTGISRKRDTEHRINPFNKDGLGAPVFCCLGLNLEVHFFHLRVTSFLLVPWPSSMQNLLFDGERFKLVFLNNKFSPTQNR